MLDHKNVCGAVCSHGVPIQQLFMSIPANESFIQYAAMLAVAKATDLLPEVEVCWEELGAIMVLVWRCVGRGWGDEWPDDSD
jgi:hypothetical protein